MATKLVIKDGKQVIETYEPVEKSAYQIACEGWHHMDYALRIIVPKSLIQQYREILIFKSYFEVMGLPIVILADEIHLYCNEILDNDKPVITQMGLVVEDRPNPEDYD